MLPDELNKLLDLIGKSDPKFSMALFDVIDTFGEWLIIAQELPPFLSEPMANIFLHQIVAQIKNANKDSELARAVALRWTVALFGLGENWEPAWVMDSFKK